jgi:DHA1 family bicyclomycin/chloramphenicol resistance-like MFS transporter
MLAAMTAIGPFSIDTYLPAFPAIGADLGVDPVQVQQTLTAYLLPFSFMILWHGALADALGRRRVILTGLAIYALASLFCATAGRIEMLWLGRALQGLSAGAGIVIGRAIVRDVLDGPAAQRMMAHVGILFAIAPAVAPIVGGWIYAWFGWHAIFIFLAVFGAAIWLAAWRLLPETLPPERRQSLEPRPLLRAYGQVFRHGRFVALSLAVSLNFGGLFVYVLSAPVFLIRHLGLSPQAFAWMFVPSVAGMMLGSYFSGRLAGHLSPNRTVLLAYVVMTAAAAANVIVNLALPPALPWTIVPLPFFTCGMALAMPSLQLMALDLFPERRGLASSCQGVIQTAASALTAAVLAPLLWGTTLTLALGQAGFMVLGLVAFAYSLLRRSAGR